MDGGIEGDLAGAPGVVAWQAGFVAGLTWDVAAGEEEIGDDVHVSVGDEVAAGCLDGFDVIARRLVALSSAAAGFHQARDNTTRPKVELTTRYCSVLGWMR